MFNDRLYNSDIPDGNRESDPPLTSAQRLNLLSALERELTNYLANEVVPCPALNRSAASTKLLSAILHCSTTLDD
jgi:hypothetical protein